MKINLRPHHELKFDAQFPIYNFFFPSQINIDEDLSINIALSNANDDISSRALYFHFPFCETLCSFCPFTKGLYKTQDDVERYVDAIVKEIQLKSKLIDLKQVPIEAIFFGGGTPSLLSPDHIIRIGKEIKKHFNLINLKEFSFEIEVKSLTVDKILAMKAIGVSHPRFGLQTFNQEWRDNFDLTATIEDIHKATSLLNKHFKYVSFDIIYGMHGQTKQDILTDLAKAVSLCTSNIDIYPIDNVMTQSKLHKKIQRKGYSITTAKSKHEMRLLIDKYMRTNGYMPHNGHGYHKTRTNDDIVSSKYSFVYHEHVYGYSDKDLLGFGVNAVSSLKNYVITNNSGRENYIRDINNNIIPVSISKHNDTMDLVKPILLRLPYHGIVDRYKSNEEKLPKEFLDKLKKLINCGLIKENDNYYKLTKQGWAWYTNIMYYLMPEIEKNYISQFIYSELDKPGKIIVMDEIIL